MDDTLGCCSGDSLVSLEGSNMKRKCIVGSICCIVFSAHSMKVFAYDDGDSDSDVSMSASAALDYPNDEVKKVGNQSKQNEEVNKVGKQDNDIWRRPFHFKFVTILVSH